MIDLPEEDRWLPRLDVLLRISGGGFLELVLEEGCGVGSSWQRDLTSVYDCARRYSDVSLMRIGYMDSTFQRRRLLKYDNSDMQRKGRQKGSES
jgi:hypothetical protein